ncbi:MAG: metallophosphoesterase [Candidatus Omnitrophica bacterium]|nr:metallophosphoesterase [Candidatus Omnitrophota bacterium]
MKKIIKTISVIVIALAIYSLIPVTALYLKKSPTPYTNEEAIEKLEDNKGEHFAFIVFGDNHSGLVFNDSATLKLISRINREDRFRKVPIDFAIVAGDLTNKGSLWDYRVYNKVRSLIKWPVISAVGNHDDDGKGAEYFREYVGKREFAFGDRNAYFIVIDNSIGDLGDEQFKKLEDELKASSAYKHRFIVAHKAPFSPYQQSWYRPELSPWSYRFMKLCEAYKIDAVFSGHEHIFKAQKFGGVKYITTGGGGMLTHFPSADGGFLHYLVVRVYGDYFDYETRRIFPPLWEFLTYYMWKEIFYSIINVIF